MSPRLLQLLIVSYLLLLGACGSNPPILMQNPETKDIIELSGSTLQCEGVLEKAGYKSTKTGR